MCLRTGVVCLLLGAAALGPAAAQDDGFALADQVNQVFARGASIVIPSVVNVSTTTVVPGRRPPIADFFALPRELMRMLSEPPQEVHSLGSGVIVGSEGYVVTNSHVVGNATRIQVGFADDQVSDATVVGADDATDLAVVKVGLTGLAAAKWGDSEALSLGEWVLAVGSPRGLEHSVTAGIISAKGRTQTAISGYEDFIQTDAPINPGNSGGALANLRGEIVGINTAIISSTGGYEGIGFAIPSNTASKIVDLLLAHGQVVRGYLGVVPAEVTERTARRLGLPDAGGVLVRAVYRDSPAHLAQLAAYDVIVGFAGQAVKDVAALARTVADTPIGQRVELVVVRRGQRMTATAVVQERPGQLSGEMWFGI